MSITIQEYDPKWKVQFEAIRVYLLQHLDTQVKSIVHIGSTSIPGLSAKAIIDIDIIIDKDKKTLAVVIETVQSLGYTHLGERGITGREAFKRNSIYAPITENNTEWFDHHLYVCTEGSIGLNNHLALKRHLLQNPDKVLEYSALKHSLAAKYPKDMDAYIDGKTDFILEILTKEGISSSDTSLIESENKSKA